MRIIALFLILSCCGTLYITAQFAPSSQDMFLPTLSKYDTEKGVNTWFYNGKTLEFENGTLRRYK
ncbi:hypothetical protein [Bacteroides acidifaciens]|uniref:hypothetical protein n=1 Tax=Bacteroides acidifaciens TaxID=85831 RepID=UPI00158E1C54|nr:hypothetical protein [Bacteroides acidifaciens]